MDYTEFCNEIMEVVDAATERYDGFYVNEDGLAEFNEALKEMYNLVFELDCNEMEINADEFKILSLSFWCDSMTLYNGRTHYFFDLIKKTKSFSFAEERGFLVVSFCFDRLWK